MYQRRTADGWKATGQPPVRQQRDKWVVRVDGIDTATAKRRSRQLGTYASKRSAPTASRSTSLEDRSDTRHTVSWLVRRDVVSRTDVTLKAREQHEWAIPHIESGLGAIRLDRLDRADVARWIDGLASGGHLSWRSVQVCRTVLRAALADAVEEGLIRRSPATRVPMHASLPSLRTRRRRSVDRRRGHVVPRPGRRSSLRRGLRLGVLYGLRRSEALALRWDDVDTVNGTLRIDEGLIAVRKGAVWSDAKNARSRRVIALDDGTMRAIARRRRQQAEERLAAGSAWEGDDLITTTRLGGAVMPRSLDRALLLIVEKAGLPRLISHGLRHTAATHMVRGARDVGELRAVADVLGHSPDVLMKVYAHALPESRRAVADRIAARTPAPPRDRC